LEENREREHKKKQCRHLHFYRYLFQELEILEEETLPFIVHFITAAATAYPESLNDAQ
jgi:hypothetical protein